VTVRLQSVTDPGAGNPLPDSYTSAVAVDLDYLVAPGADLASAGTVTITSKFHRLTGTTTVHDLNDSIGAVAGQRVELFLKDGSVTFQNNGGGTGNIRTPTGADVTFTQNTIVILEYDGTLWRVQNAAATTIYRKLTTKQVVSSVAETDLLNGEITIGAGVVDANHGLRIRCWGSFVLNGGTGFIRPQFKLKLGSTTLIDTNTASGSTATSARECFWRMDAFIENLGATNSQQVDFKMRYRSQNTEAQDLTTGIGHDWASADTGFIDGYNTAAVDMTTAQALAFTCINPINNANEWTKLFAAIVEVV
jgi:hypothetical protein